MNHECKEIDSLIIQYTNRTDRVQEVLFYRSERILI